MTGKNPASTQLRTAVGFFVLLGSSLTLALLIYRTSGEALAGWSSRSIVAAAVVAIGALSAAALLAKAFRDSADDRRSQLWLPLTASAFIAMVCLGMAEVTVRLLARPDARGVRVGALTLVPYSWRLVADTNLGHLRSFRERPESYFAEDSLLGWSVGVDRETLDGMYRSSDDGIRTMRRGERLAERGVRRRVALFGDSYTFSMEVPFEESWAHYLTGMLPADTQVLDFGVDGYGVDQTYLRFTREAPKWRPAIAVFTLIEDDLYRVVSLYPFLRGWVYPFSRPRFVLQADSLALLNVPVFRADSIFARPSIDQLPFIDMDVFYDPEQWKWRFVYHSYLVRLLVTAFPRWPLGRESTSDAVILQLSSRIVERFVREARALGAQPVVAFLPSRNYFVTHAAVLEGKLAPLLRERGIRLNDLTPCLSQHVAPLAMFLEGRVHYSAAGNAAVAACMEPLIAPLLAATNGT